MTQPFGRVYLVGAGGSGSTKVLSSSVTLNNRKATSLAVNELYAQGFRKIHFVTYHHLVHL